jgi:methionyl-tRNA formyltransferase
MFMVRQPALRIVYFGTPEFAVPALRAIAEDDRFEVRLVVTQPDRPAGRGQRLTPSPVKQAAEQLGLSVYQPSKLKADEDREPLIGAEADVFVVAAFGLIFGRRTLEIPRLGCVNLHASILPKYRGASPVAAAIAAGDDETGISLMKMEAGLDTGPVIAVSKVAIESTETTETLTAKLADLGARLAVEKLDPFASGELEPFPQGEVGASVTRTLKKADGWLDWSWPASKLVRWVRAMWPWPRAWTTLEGQPIQVHRASVGDFSSNHRPGTIVAIGDAIAVQTGEGVLLVDVIQLAGGKPLEGSVAARSGRLPVGTILGESGAPEPQPPLITELLVSSP